MAKATKKTDAPTPRAGKKGAAAKSRKPSSKAEIASARNKDASGQDPSDGLSLNAPGLAASPEVLNRLWTIIDGRKGVDAAVSHSARLLAKGCGYRKSHPGWRTCRDELSLLRDDRPLEAARRIARRTVQIARGSRSRDGISLPAACCPAAVRAGEAQAAHGRSLDLRLALSAVPVLARSRGCL